jgi:hypothetical protein
MSEEEEKSPRPLFQTSVDTRLMITELNKLSEGETITKEDLTRIIGPEWEKLYSSYSTAKRGLEYDGLHFTLANGCVKRLNHEECVNLTTDDGQKRLKNQARRRNRTLAHCDPDKLSDGARVKRDAAMSGFAATELFNQPKTVERIERIVEHHRGKVEVEKLLGLFKKKD